MSDRNTQWNQSSANTNPKDIKKEEPGLQSCARRVEQQGTNGTLSKVDPVGRLEPSEPLSVVTDPGTTVERTREKGSCDPIKEKLTSKENSAEKPSGSAQVAGERTETSAVIQECEGEDSKSVSVFDKRRKPKRRFIRRDSKEISRRSTREPKSKRSRERVKRISRESTSSREKAYNTSSQRANSQRSLKETRTKSISLEDQAYYHGFRPRKDVVCLMKEPGDFLIRATDSRHLPEYVISVLNDKRELINLTLKRQNDKWQLGLRRKRGLPMPRFTQVEDLVDYYHTHRLPGHARLRRGIARPPWLIKHENVVFDRAKDLLGTGNFCNVYKGVYHRSPEEKINVAVKICHEGRGADKSFEETKEAREQMLEEAQMMSYYVHNHVVEMYGVACNHPPVLIIMEYCPGGNLEEHLKTQKELIEVGERIVYALEAARGMQFLHRKNCIHRDLAARNCLISAKGQIKISDFGLSKLAGELEKMNGAIADEPAPQIPLRWMAPESLHRPMRFSTKSDVWSFAVMLYEIFNQGEKPWKEEPAKKIATLIRHCQMPSFPQTTPKEISNLASRIWVLDPHERPSMKDVNYSLLATSRLFGPPPPENFTLNKLEGVCRTRTLCQYSVEDTADEEDDGAEAVAVDNARSSPRPRFASSEPTSTKVKKE